MKKLLALLLAMVMLLSLAACGGSEDEDEDDDDKGGKLFQREEDEEETESDDEEEIQSGNEEMTQAPVASMPLEDETAGYTEYESVENTVIIDNEYLTVTLLGFGEEGLDYSVQNKAERAISFSVEDAAFNGWMGDCWTSVDVAPGESAEDVLYLYDDSINEVDPADITRLSMSVTAYDSESYETIVQKLVDVYPEGKDACVFEEPTQEIDTVIFDENDLYAAVTGYGMNEAGYYTVSLVYRNTSSDTIYGEASVCTVNELGWNDGNSTTVLPDTYARGYVWLDKERLELIGIEEVTSMDLYLSAYDTNWDTLAENICTKLYPEGEENAQAYTYTADEDDVLVLEEKDLKLTMAFVEQSDYYTQIYFYLENGTGDILTVSSGEIKINGKVAEGAGLFGYGMTPSNYFCELTLYADTLEELGIEKIETIEMELDIYNDGYDSLVTETVTVTMP